MFFTTDATTVAAPTAFEAVSDYTSRRRPLHGCYERWQFRLRRGGASGVAEGPWHTGVSSLSVQLRRLSCFSLNCHPVLGQAVNQSAEMRSSLEFFATALSCRVYCQAYKNEVYLLPTELVEASQRTHREHSPNDVVVKVPVRSCRECHQETADHQFVDKQWIRVPSFGLRWSSSQQHRCSSSTSSTLFIRFLVVVTASVIHGILA